MAEVWISFSLISVPSDSGLIVLVADCSYCDCSAPVKISHWLGRYEAFLYSSKQNSPKESIHEDLVWLFGPLMFILVCIPSAMLGGHTDDSSDNEIFLRSIHFLLNRCCSRKVRELWWQGIPPSVRGKVWSLAIGNELNITHGETVVLTTLCCQGK